MIIDVFYNIDTDVLQQKCSLTQGRCAFFMKYVAFFDELAFPVLDSVNYTVFVKCCITLDYSCIALIIRKCYSVRNSPQLGA